MMTKMDAQFRRNSLSLTALLQPPSEESAFTVSPPAHRFNGNGVRGRIRTSKVTRHFRLNLSLSLPPLGDE